jgi:methanogenic corrinoid protein MtbC1
MVSTENDCLGARVKADEDTYNCYFSSLLTGNRMKCEEIVSDLINRKMPVKNLYQELFQRSLYQIGELWEFNKISVAVEHMATSVTESLMNMVYPVLISSERIGNKIIVGCVEDELHQIGAKMAADIFEMYGWDSIYLGANVPTYELIRFISEIKPDLIGLSFSVYFHLNNLEKMITLIRKEFENIGILVGGQAVRMDLELFEKRYPGVTCVNSLDALEAFIKKGE